MVAATALLVLGEFLGTFLLVITTFVTGSNPLAVGGIVALIMFLLQNISKGVINPAVAYSMALKGDMSWATSGIYVTAEILGGLAAALAYMWVSSE